MKRVLIAIPYCREKAKTTDVLLRRNEVVEFFLDLDKVQCKQCLESINSCRTSTDLYYNSRVCVVCPCVPECQWALGVRESLPSAVLGDIYCSSNRQQESPTFLGRCVSIHVIAQVTVCNGSLLLRCNHTHIFLVDMHLQLSQNHILREFLYTEASALEYLNTIEKILIPKLASLQKII